MYYLLINDLPLVLEGQMVPGVLGHLVVPKRGGKNQNKNINVINITESGIWHFAIEQHLIHHVR